MCANFGFYKVMWPEGFDVRRLIGYMAVKCQTYGDKSTGLYGVSGGVKHHERHTGPASEWVAISPDKIAKLAESPAVIGHTRWPTKGAVAERNTHPFPIGDWMVTHNGCISNSEALKAKAVCPPVGETDSEEALVYIVEQDWSRESLLEIHGGFALTAVTKDLSRGWLICDDRQNLYVAKIGDGYAWCTSKEILGSALFIAGMNEVPTIYKLDDQILSLNTGVVTPLGTKDKPKPMAQWELDMLERTRNGGRGYTAYQGDGKGSRSTWTGQGWSSDRPGKSSSKKAKKAQRRNAYNHHPKPKASKPTEADLARHIAKDFAEENGLNDVERKEFEQDLLQHGFIELDESFADGHDVQRDFNGQILGDPMTDPDLPEFH